MLVTEELCVGECIGTLFSAQLSYKPKMVLKHSLLKRDMGRNGEREREREGQRDPSLPPWGQGLGFPFWKDIHTHIPAPCDFMHIKVCETCGLQSFQRVMSSAINNRKNPPLIIKQIVFKAAVWEQQSKALSLQQRTHPLCTQKRLSNWLPAPTPWKGLCPLEWVSM